MLPNAANADLIAAAPELLAALKEAEVYLEPCEGRSYSRGQLQVYEKVRAAIAKAEGKAQKR